MVLLLFNFSAAVLCVLVIAKMCLAYLYYSTNAPSRAMKQEWTTCSIYSSVSVPAHFIKTDNLLCLVIRHWHDYCFKCDLCRRPLQSDGKFTFYKDKTLCTTCYATNYQKACKSCSKPIDSGGSRLEYNGNYFHERCFVCKICLKEIGTSGFVPKDDEFYCPSCFQNEFSKRCVGCGEPLLEGGVLYGGQTWHKTCFTCHYCHRSLAANAFSVRDGFRYCMECYGTFYAKQCEICMKPIVGGEYYTLDESNFHKDCFMCSRCSRSLASEGFVREGTELLCANCAD